MTLSVFFASLIVVAAVVCLVTAPANSGLAGVVIFAGIVAFVYLFFTAWGHLRQ